MVVIKEKEFKRFTEYIHKNYGIHLKGEKLSLVAGRLQNVFTGSDFKNFSEYYDHVVSDKTGNAAAMLIERITTNHTFFMREIKHFDYFKNVVLPYLANTVKDRDLRIWSAGCSSGEEPYTLAMVIDEFLRTDKLGWDARILATDISNKVLDMGRKGVYKNEALGTLPKHWRSLYFKKYNDENSIICDKIKKEVIFRKLNLMESFFPFKKKFHVIFCRNVMIYFDSKTRKRLVNKFYNHTLYGGYLFIGHSESINGEGSDYKYIMPAVYRKE